jgi:enterochelin esterase-like enzyme
MIMKCLLKMKAQGLWVVFLLVPAITHGQLPSVVAGSIRRFDNFPSQVVAPRKVDVWLPEGYTASKKYAVLYMHDGNSLYDSATMWNRQEWGVDETASRLLQENKIKDIIVVGVWNNGAYRHAEYFPQKILKQVPEKVRRSINKEQLKSKPLSDKYLQFLVKELKPFIDSTFSTLQDSRNTFIAGSSMGGLISLYAICEYPNVFGGAACLSTHTPLIMKEMISSDVDRDVASKFRNYLAVHLPNPKTHKIYMDYGDKTLDSFYKPYQQKIDLILKAKGFTSVNWITKYFPGEDHSENAWRKRLYIPLLFLLKK